VNRVVLNHGIGEQGAGYLIEIRGGGLGFELDLEAFSLSHTGNPGHTKPGKSALNGLTLGVEDLRFEHDVDDDAGHGLLRLLEGRGLPSLYLSARRVGLPGLPCTTHHFLEVVAGGPLQRRLDLVG